MSENYDTHPNRLTELLEFAGQARKPVRELEIGVDPHQGELLDLLLAALNEATTGTRTRIIMHGRPYAMIIPFTRNSGPAVFRTIVYGDSYPALIEAATAEARGFYGPDAPLAVEHVGVIHNTLGSMARASRGEYSTEVTIRCTQLPDGWIVP